MSPARSRRRRYLGRLLLLIASLVVAFGAAELVLPVLREVWPPADDSGPIGAAVYMPAEFGPQEELLLGGAQLAELFPDVLSDIVRAAAGELRIRILAGSPAGRARIDSVLADNGLADAAVEIVELPIRSMWVRDFGPVTVSDAAGRRLLLDFHYRERRGNVVDDGVPGHLARNMGLDLKTSPLLLEGGDFLSNGRGLGLLSTRVVNRNAHYLDLALEQTVNDLGILLGFEGVSLVPPLQGESTGHVDMFCAFLRTDLLVVGRLDPAGDAENAAQLDWIAEDQARRPTIDGPLRVERVPMPDHDDGVWRTYTNIVFANGVLLVPVYPDYCPELDKVALAFYRRLLPDRRVVGIDASGLIRMKGALRCVTMNVPRGVPLLPAGSNAGP